MHRLLTALLFCSVCIGAALAGPGLTSTPAPSAVAPAEAAKSAPPPAVAAPATLVVHLPASATLKVDGKKTSTGAAKRVVTSAALAPGQSHEFKLEAELTSHGQKVNISTTVTVSAGESIELPLEIKEEGGAKNASAK